MIRRTILLLGLAIACPVAPASAQTADHFITSWLAMVTATQDQQPRWMTPVVTVTPRLEQELRLDYFSETLNNHAHLNNYGAGKGVEIIPAPNTEIIFGIPPYDVRSSNTGQTLADGWADWPAFLIKYRLLSANEQQGNYVLTGFFQLSAPTGNTAFSNRFYIVQPTLAFGRGWGDFDIQATISEQFAAWGTSTAERNFGNPVLVNVAAQYHLFDVLWPAVELNETWWPNGPKQGKIQTFVTPEIVFGRFEIYDRVRLIMGLGYQIAASPVTPAYRNNLIFTFRTAF
ncbi:MAG TPA: hypothetical protein VFW28_09505 [Micropepsaceae bacterium]|nr:hypothetical protein [Micropepsaceae bacterium]